MSKKGRVAIVKLTILALGMLILSVIFASKFFTNDKVEKNIIAKVEDKRMPEKIIYQNTVNDEVEIQEDTNETEVTEEIEKKTTKTEVTSRNKDVSDKNVNDSNVVEKPNVVSEVKKEETVEESPEILTNYKGFSTIGKIEIPRTGLNTYILSNMTTSGMGIAPCKLYSTGELNKSGNTLILGHNYMNGKLFSNNKNLQIGDKIYITSLDGQRKEYVVYNKFETTPEDTSFIRRNTSGGPEITLSTCTDDGTARTIILAK